MSVTFCGQALTFKEDAVWGSSGGGTGWRVWDASLVALRLTEGALPLPPMVSATLAAALSCSGSQSRRCPDGCGLRHVRVSRWATYRPVCRSSLCTLCPEAISPSPHGAHGDCAATALWRTVLGLQLRLPRCRVLDLSCGTGVFGLALAVARPSLHVTLSDLEQQLDLVRDNVASYADEVEGRVNVIALPWGAASGVTDPFDVVVCCDAVFSAVSSGATAALVATVVRLATMCPVLLVWEERLPVDEAAFLAELRAASKLVAVDTAAVGDAIASAFPAGDVGSRTPDTRHKRFHVAVARSGLRVSAGGEQMGGATADALTTPVTFALPTPVAHPPHPLPVDFNPTSFIRSLPVEVAPARLRGTPPVDVDEPVRWGFAVAGVCPCRRVACRGHCVPVQAVVCPDAGGDVSRCRRWCAAFGCRCCVLWRALGHCGASSRVNRVWPHGHWPTDSHCAAPRPLRRRARDVPLPQQVDDVHERTGRVHCHLPRPRRLAHLVRRRLRRKSRC